ncbi:hypothetical protein [Clostridium lacusfryxellense]|nr:hypothetical protein [Clostridium lacusfryxellense]
MSESFVIETIEDKKIIEEYINGILGNKDVTCNHHREHHHQ